MMSAYKTHVFVYPLIDGKASEEAELVETVMPGKYPADRVRYWVNKAVAWNDAEKLLLAADPKYKPVLVSTKYSALTTTSDGKNSFGKKFEFPTK